MRSIGSKGRRKAPEDSGTSLRHSAACRGGPSPASRVPLPMKWGGKGDCAFHPYSVLAMSSFMISLVPP